ncbi:hypothetical protein ACQPYK_29180 [Streptosporangium sp. CA-135522]|uniref:hypothetical protein n=1 Tax=Streptosporangium sp. CA-135522 TaxID=3240072 RepID=UPI003D904EB7
MIDEFDWAHLQHAYGPATDTPRHLVALTSSDRDVWRSALDHLDGAVLHQGFPESATAPAARVVAWLIATDAVGAEVGEELIDFLGAVADATAHVRDQAFFAPLLPALEASIVEAHPVVAALLDSPAPRLRLRAAEAAVEQVRLPRLAAERPLLAARLRQWATHQASQRLQCVRLLGELGEQVDDFLADADAAVRIRAALAPASHEASRATDIIVAALGEPPPAGVHLSELVEAAIARVESFERIAKPAIAIARRADWTGFDDGWGPLLRFAFVGSYRPEVPLSCAQRRFLRELVRNDRLWDPRNGSVALAFHEVGLPHDRSRCASIVSGQGPMRPS